MTNRNLSILGMVAVSVVALAVIIAGIADKPYAKKDQVAYLIQGLDLDHVARIVIGKPGEEVTLNRRGANFVVANLDNYPALTSEINRLFTACLDIQTSSLYTDNPENHKELGVTEDKASVIVKFYKADSSLLTGFILGKQKEKGQGIGFIRRIDDNKVYLTASQIPAIRKQAIDYVEQGLLKVKRDDINSVTISSPNDTYLLKPDPDGKTVIFANLSEGKKLGRNVTDVIFNALAELNFEDVNAESRKSNLQFDRRVLCRLKDTTVYTIWLAKDGDTWFVKCDAEFADKTPITKTQGQVESDAQLKIKETKLIARDDAEEFSDTHKGWVYQIPSNLAENLTKSASELIKSSNPVLTEVNSPDEKE